MKILIIGATGNIGQHMARQLVKAGVRPVAGVRDTAKARDQLGDEVDYVFFDFNKPRDFKTALRGIGKVFFIAPHEDPVSSVKSLLEITKDLGIQHILFSSGRTTGDVEGRPLHEVERLVRNCGLPQTILRPGWFMQNFISWLGGPIREENKILLPAGNVKTAFVDVRDIAAVAVAILTSDKEHNNRIYELTSEEAIDHYQVAEIIGKVSKRDLVYEPLDRGAFIKEMVRRGWSVDDAIYTADLYDFVRRGKEAAPSPDVEMVLGRKPLSFLEFALDYREAWA